jgi:hypothetical protein
VPPDLHPCQDPGVTLAPGISITPTILAAGGTATITYGAPAPLAASDTVPKWHGFVKVKLQGKALQLQAYALGDPTPRDTLTYSKP